MEQKCPSNTKWSLHFFPIVAHEATVVHEGKITCPTLSTKLVREPLEGVHPNFPLFSLYPSMAAKTV